MSKLSFLGILLIIILCGCKNKNPVGAVVNVNISDSDLAFYKWKPATAPGDSSLALQFIDNMAKLCWYNPLDRIPIKDIWPDTSINQNTSLTVDVLSLNFIPKSSLSWAGIMQEFREYLSGDIDSSFCEICIKGDEGTVHIDLGQVSEDFIPNGKLDREYFSSNDIDITDEDIGIDGMKGEDPPFLFNSHQYATAVDGVGDPYDFWDINEDGVKQLSEPWSYDDFDVSYGNDYTKINGTEGNSQLEEIDYRDTEDINCNGSLDVANNYYHISFNLGKSHSDAQYITSGYNNPYGWYIYRIPIYICEYIGNTDIGNVEFIRIWFDDIGSETTLQIASIKFY